MNRSEKAENQDTPSNSFIEIADSGKKEIFFESLREIKSMKESYLRTIRDLTVVITILGVICFFLLVCVFQYLLQFKADEIDDFVSKGIDAMEERQIVSLPIESKIQLSQNFNAHPIFWDEQSETWMVKVKNSVRPFFHHQIFPVKAWTQLHDWGFAWQDGDWVPPEGF